MESKVTLVLMVTLDTQTANHVLVADMPIQSVTRKVANVIAQRILLDLNVTLALKVTMDIQTAIHVLVAVIPIKPQAVTREVVNVIAM